MTGMLLVDKPKGPTSHGVVQAVRRMTGQRRCGHTGTLDPSATGLLVLCLGPATRLARFVSPWSKTYEAVVRFGIATDTYDATGVPAGDPGNPHVDSQNLESVLKSFVGRQEQLPPPYAAKKVQGERMYRLARAGVPVERRPQVVFIHRVELKGLEETSARLEVEVGSGTYIRSLAHDIGERLGCGAHLSELRRTRVGRFKVEEALTMERIETLAREGQLSEQLISPKDALADLAAVRLSEEGARCARHGNSVPGQQVEGELPRLTSGQMCRLLEPGGELLSVARFEEPAHFRPVVVLSSPQERDDPAEVGSAFTG